MNSFTRKILYLSLLLIMSTSLHASIYIIVSNKSNISSISTSKLKQAYLGKLVSASGRTLQPVEYASSNPLQKAFTQSIIRLNTSLLMQYRSRLIFSGKGRLPRKVGSQSAMLSVVARSPSAIGFVSKKPSTSAVKVIKTL